MSLINCKEDSVKTNMLMEEGDSSLEPGEVKTPPHGPESVKTKMSEEINTKCGTPQYLPLVKSASKKETDKCAEKVRAILELDAIKRKEELERRKEEKSEFLSLQSKNKKKEQKKQKNTKEGNDMHSYKYYPYQINIFSHILHKLRNQDCNLHRSFT